MYLTKKNEDKLFKEKKKISCMKNFKQIKRNEERQVMRNMKHTTNSETSEDMVLKNASKAKYYA